MPSARVAESDSAESVESMEVDEVENNNKADAEAVHEGFQHFNKLLRFLPYSASIPDEACRDMAAILYNLTRAVQCRDLQVAAHLCTSNLNS